MPDLFKYVAFHRTAGFLKTFDVNSQVHSVPEKNDVDVFRKLLLSNFGIMKEYTLLIIITYATFFFRFTQNV